MINCLYYSLFFALFLSVSFGSLRYSQINRCFMSIYKGMFEACLITIDSNGEPILPYFDKKEIDKYIYNYFNVNLSKFTKNYTVNLEYFNIDKTEYCTNYCSYISINLNAKINEFFYFNKTKDIKVESRLNYEQ